MPIIHVERFMSRISPKDFVGTRCRFQRLRDAKIFNGWINNYFGNEVVLATSTDSAVQIGDEFRVEGYGNQISVVFNAILKEVSTLDLTTSAKVSEIGGNATFIEAKQVAFVLDVVGVVRFSASQEPVRLKVSDLEVELTISGKKISGFAVDISNMGAGVVVTQEVPKGSVFELQLHSPFGVVTAVGGVRYCRPDPDRPQHFRIGLLFTDLGRIERPRWERLHKEGA